MKKFHIFSHQRSFFRKLFKRFSVSNKLFNYFSKNKVIIIGLIILILAIAIIIFIPIISHNQELKRTKNNKNIACPSNSKQVWCAASQKCINPVLHFCADRTNNFVNNLNKSTGLELKNSGQTSIIWNIKNPHNQVTSTLVKGELYELGNLPYAQVLKIQKYLSSKGKLDDLNIINGLSGGLRGYRQGNLVCTLGFRYKEMHMNRKGKIVPVSDSLNVKLKCGFLESSFPVNK